MTGPVEALWQTLMKIRETDQPSGRRPDLGRRVAALALAAVSVVLIGSVITLPWWIISGVSGQGQEVWYAYYLKYSCSDQGPCLGYDSALQNTFDLTLGLVLAALACSIVVLPLTGLSANRPTLGSAVVIFRTIGSVFLLAAPVYLYFSLPVEVAAGPAKCSTLGSGFFGSCTYQSPFIPPLTIRYTYGGASGWYVAIVTAPIFFLSGRLASLRTWRRAVPTTAGESPVMASEGLALGKRSRRAVLVDINQRGVVSVVAAMLGLVSMFLPWVVFSASGSPSSLGESPAQLIADFLSPPPQTGPVDPAVTAWEIQSVLGAGLWLIGSIVFAVGFLIAAVGIFARLRWAGAGLVMLVGSCLAAGGIASFSTTFTSSSTGVQYTVGPSYGVVVAIGSSLLALVPLILPLVLKKARIAAPAQAPRAAPTPALRTLGLANRFCPLCGDRYSQDPMFCPKDGATLKPLQ